jgi:hypothetical protein
VFRRKPKEAEVVEIFGAAYGLGIAMAAPSADVLARMRPALPVGWVQHETAEQTLRFALLPHDDGADYGVFLDEEMLAQSSLEDALTTLRGLVDEYLASNAPEVVFLHAGAVAYKGRGIVIPGRSFSGKTTLVAALAQAGAEYYSDEYAVLNSDGQLIPYPKDLSLRLVEGEQQQTHTSVTSLGGTAGTGPVPVDMVLLTEYRSAASWEPSEISTALGIVGTLAHAEPAQVRPQETLATVTKALAGATVLQGHRGDAHDTAAAILARLDA